MEGVAQGGGSLIWFCFCFSFKDDFGCYNESRPWQVGEEVETEDQLGDGISSR